MRRRWGRTKSGLNWSDRMGPIEHKYMYNAAANLLEAHEFSPELLKFVLPLIHSKDRIRFAGWINGQVRPKRRQRTSCIDVAGNTDDLARDLVVGVARKRLRISQQEIIRHLVEMLEIECGRKLGRAKAKAGADKLTGELRNIFGLTDEEIDLVCLLYCYKTYEPFEDLCDNYRIDGRLKLFAIALDRPLYVVKKMLSPKSRLVNSAILETADYSSRRGNIGDLNNEIVSFLSGMDDAPFSEKYCRKDARKTYALDSFRVPGQSMEVMKSLLETDRPCHILLHGKAGTGKTEFARAVTASTGKEAYFVRFGEENGSQKSYYSGDRRIALQVASACVPGQGSVLIVDEADTLLNSGFFMFGTHRAPEKGWLNTFLDEAKCQVIWITNGTDYMEESTLRRFAYSVKFKKFTKRDREEIWKQLLVKHPVKRLITEKMIGEFAKHYEVNAAGIASALDTLKEVLPARGKGVGRERVKQLLCELLERHQEATGQQKSRGLNVLTDKYDASVLNIDADRDGFIAALKGFVAHKAETGGKVPGNLNLLFWGEPGTGKTECAKYLADIVGMDLIVRRASDLLSCWVGGTEANIRDAFDEAERAGAILFLDEADSFFIDRANAVRAYESSRTNELLTQMENHNGVLICCTNMLDHLDKAVARRFPWKVQFKALTPEKKVKIYKKYFPLVARMTPAQKRRIEAIPGLTPGDVKAVLERFRFATPEDLTHGTLIKALEEEVKYKKGAESEIGFPAE